MIAPMENATSDAAAAISGEGRSDGLTPSSSNAWMASALSGCAEISAAASRAVAALMPRRRSMPTSSARSAAAVLASSWRFLFGLPQLVLRGARHKSPRGHRERARREPGEAGEQDRMLRTAAAADAGD